VETRSRIHGQCQELCLGPFAADGVDDRRKLIGISAEQIFMISSYKLLLPGNATHEIVNTMLIISACPIHQSQILASTVVW